MQIVNVSSQKLFIHHRMQPSGADPGGASAIAVRPGQTLDLPGRQDGLPSMVWLYQPRGAGAGGRKLFWKGHVPPGAVIDADPEAGRGTWNGRTFDEAHLARARAFVGDGSLDGVTLEALRDHAATRDPKGPPPDAVLAAEPAAADGAVVFSECELKVASVVLDCVLLVLGMGSLIKELNTPPVVNAVAKAVGQAGLDAQMNAIEQLAAVPPTGLEMAGKVFGVIEKLSTTFPTVVEAVISNLGLLDKVLYGGLAAVQIAAIAASGGTWAIPFVAIQLGLSGLLLGKDIVSCYQACKPGVPLPIVPPVVSKAHWISGEGRWFVPSSGTDPKTLLWLERGTYHDPEQNADLWDIQRAGQREVTIRSVLYPEHYVAAPLAIGGVVTVEPLAAVGGKQGGRVLWIPKRFPPAKIPEGTVGGYILQNASPTLGSAAIHVAGEHATLQSITKDEAPNKSNFYFQDFGPGRDLADEIRIGWRLELFVSVDDWQFWNGDERGATAALPYQEGTLTRPNDVNYWSVVAMARSIHFAQGVAMVRYWSDASGRYVQAKFAVTDSWTEIGREGQEISTASVESNGVILSAWIIPDDES